jgi:hypothetical protein
MSRTIALALLTAFPTSPPLQLSHQKAPAPLKPNPIPSTKLLELLAAHSKFPSNLQRAGQPLDRKASHTRYPTLYFLPRVRSCRLWIPTRRRLPIWVEVSASESTLAMTMHPPAGCSFRRIILPSDADFPSLAKKTWKTWTRSRIQIHIRTVRIARGTSSHHLSRRRLSTLSIRRNGLRSSRALAVNRKKIERKRLRLPPTERIPSPLRPLSAEVFLDGAERAFRGVTAL